MNIESAKIAIDKMAFFIPEHILNDLYKDHGATAEVLAQDDDRVVFSIVYHDKKEKRILSVTVKRHSVDVHYNGNMQVFSHRIDESFFNDVVNVLSDVQPNQDVEMENTVKSLVIKTASHVIYVVNGKVSCVRCANTGRFVAVKKFANIVNGLIVKAKNVSDAIKANNEFYYNVATKLAMCSFKNMAKMATALLGQVRVFTSRNYCHDAFNHTVLSLYA